MRRWLPFALLLSACHIPEANVYNIREVRDLDGSANRVGAPMEELEYLFRRSLLSNMASGDLGLGEKEDGPIEDPDTIALENLVALAECDSDDPFTLGLQVEVFSWLSVDDNYALARERSTLELGKLGKLLGVKQPQQLQEGEVAATPTEVADVLGDLIRHTRPFLEGNPGDREALAETCAEISALTLNREGSRRLLSASNVLLNAAGFDDDDVAALRSTHRELMERSVALALGETVRDRHEIVRAASVDACVAVSDNGLPSVQLQALEDPFSVVVLRVLRSIRANGIPRSETELAGEDVARWRLLWLEQLIAASQDLRGEVSIAACLALSEVSGAPLRSLRWEDWSIWWEEEVRSAPSPRSAGDEAADNAPS